MHGAPAGKRCVSIEKGCRSLEAPIATFSFGLFLKGAGSKLHGDFRANELLQDGCIAKHQPSTPIDHTFYQVQYKQTRKSRRLRPRSRAFPDLPCIIRTLPKGILGVSQAK